MRAMADEEFVQRDEALSVVEIGLDHRALLVRAFPRRRRGAAPPRTPDDAGRALPRRDAAPVQADDRLPREVLRDVRDETVLAERDDDVVRLEEEPVEVCASMRLRRHWTGIAFMVVASACSNAAWRA